MYALTVVGQKEFKAELAKAAKSDDPADAIEYVVSSWLRTSFLMAEPCFRESLDMLPELSKQSEEMTLEQLSERIGDFEIIVVNDGSTDATAAIVTAIAESDPHVRLISHTINQGYGAALVSGFAAASRELTFFMDSDGQFDIRDL